MIERVEEADAQNRQDRDHAEDDPRRDEARARRENHDEVGKESGSQEPEQDGAEGSKPEQASLWSRLRRHKLGVAIGAVVLIAAVTAAILWYLNARHFETTDDAFIDGRPVAISPEVSGYIVSVPVTDNQPVRAGDLLAEIDPRDYIAAVQQAQAQIAQFKSNVASARAQLQEQSDQITEASNQVEQAQAALSFSRDQDFRAQDLVKKGAGTVQNAQQTASDLKSKNAGLSAANAALAAARRQVDVLKAQIETGEAQIAQAQAQLAAAQANLSRTKLHATLDGRVTKLTAALGAAAAPGQALMVLTPNDLWVTANFKETQLADMRPGQPVDIEIDAYGRSYPGKVDSVQSGSGTAFSLLPAENATGNYVKVVQRVPVKIVFDKPPDVQIGPGMSVVPTVRVR